MSNASNDVLYERARELMPYLSGGEALDLNASLEDLERMYELVKGLERKYLGHVQDDALITLRASLNGSQEAWHAEREGMTVDEKLEQDDEMADREYEESVGK